MDTMMRNTRQRCRKWETFPYAATASKSTSPVTSCRDTISQLIPKIKIKFTLPKSKHALLCTPKGCRVSIQRLGDFEFSSNGTCWKFDR